MSPTAISLIALACVLAATVLGTVLRAVLPEQHLTDDSKDLIKLGTGLIAMMAALVLGLLLAAAKRTYDAAKSELLQFAANLGLFDRALAHYGPETREARRLLRRSVPRPIDQLWSRNGSASAAPEPGVIAAELLYDKIQELSPQNDAQRTTKTQALGIALDVGRTRWLLFEQRGRSISTPFLVVLIFWFIFIFASFGLFAPRNTTALVVLFVCALSLASALFLILELDGPFDGLIQIPSSQLQNTLAYMEE